jgi:hypothetical protein
MGLFTSDIKTMEDLVLHVMQDIYFEKCQKNCHGALVHPF